MVMAGTVVEPGSDAGVVCVHLGDTKKYIAMANDGNGRYCYLDPYRGGLAAMAECVRNLACSGARALAMTDNLNFGNPNKPEVFFTLRESVRGLAEACRAYDVPVVGGNVSLYNENQAGAIDPTPVVTVMGLIESAEHVTTQFCREPGERLVLIGGLPDELGASQFLKIVHGLKTGRAPEVDLEKEKRQNAFLLERIASGSIRAAHDLAEGGLLVALAEMLLRNPGLGLAIRLRPGAGRRLDAVLYGESQGRILISVKPDRLDEVTAAAARAGVATEVLGEVTADGCLSLEVEGRDLAVTWPVAPLKELWETSIEKRMARPGLVHT
jgi:phosphoribosylformylglycinamidine synthase